MKGKWILLACCLLLAMVAGCVPLKKKPVTTTPVVTPTKAETRKQETSPVDAQIKAAANAPLPRRHDLMLQAAQTSMQQGDGLGAETAFNAINPEQLTPAQLQFLSELPGRFGKDKDAVAACLHTTWSAVSGLREDELHALASNQDGSVLQGWAELALLMRNQAIGHEQQLAALGQWQSRWRTHPAAASPPDDVAYLRQSIQPSSVTLLLPLSGRLAPVGLALRDGFMAAYYQALQQQQDVPRVVVVDSEQSNDFVQHYLFHAQQPGTDMVIGPLDKAQVALLAKQDKLPVPTLALNYSDDGESNTINLFQFGLDPEDEAREIANRAQQDGHLNALVIAADTLKNQRIVDSFTRHWQQLGGKIVADIEYQDRDTIHTRLSAALGIEESEERWKTIRTYTADKVEFQPRVRKDIDMIFMLANPNDGRLIKPSLAFLYADKIPVYSTSQIYTGTENAVHDIDLDGVRFTVLPWLYENSALKQSVDTNARPSAVTTLFYAMGIDAFRLYPRLGVMQRNPQLSLHGSTGDLSLQDKHRVQRKPAWAVITAGRGQLLPTVTAAPADTDPGH